MQTSWYMLRRKVKEMNDSLWVYSKPTVSFSPRAKKILSIILLRKAEKEQQGNTGQAVSTSVQIKIWWVAYCCSDEQCSTQIPGFLALSLPLNAHRLMHLHCLQPSLTTKCRDAVLNMKATAPILSNVTFTTCHCSYREALAHILLIFHLIRELLVNSFVSHPLGSSWDLNKQVIQEKPHQSLAQSYYIKFIQWLKIPHSFSFSRQDNRIRK